MAKIMNFHAFILLILCFLLSSFIKADTSVRDRIANKYNVSQEGCGSFDGIDSLVDVEILNKIVACFCSGIRTIVFIPSISFKELSKKSDALLVNYIKSSKEKYIEFTTYNKDGFKQNILFYKGEGGDSKKNAMLARFYLMSISAINLFSLFQNNFSRLSINKKKDVISDKFIEINNVLLAHLLEFSDKNIPFIYQRNLFRKSKKGMLSAALMNQELKQWPEKDKKEFNEFISSEEGSVWQEKYQKDKKIAGTWIKEYGSMTIKELSLTLNMFDLILLWFRSPEIFIDRPSLQKVWGYIAKVLELTARRLQLETGKYAEYLSAMDTVDDE